MKYRVYQSEHRIISAWWGGCIRHNILRRVVSDLNDSQITDEFVAENRAIMMYSPLISDGENNFSNINS